MMSGNLQVLHHAVDVKKHSWPAGQKDSVIKGAILVFCIVPCSLTVLMTTLNKPSCSCRYLNEGLEVKTQYQDGGAGAPHVQSKDLAMLVRLVRAQCRHLRTNNNSSHMIWQPMCTRDIVSVGWVLTARLHETSVTGVWSYCSTRIRSVLSSKIQHFHVTTKLYQLGTFVTSLLP